MPAPPTGQRQVALVLSPKAAAVLDRAIEEVMDQDLPRFQEDESDILAAIREEIREQLPKAKKARKK